MEQVPQADTEVRLHFLDYWRVVKTRKAIVFVVFLLVVLVAATVTYFQPKIYQAATRIKVEMEQPTVSVFTSQAVPTYDPYFLATQYEIIQSKKILYPVIEKMGLQEKWGGGQKLPPEVLFRRLKGRIAVRRYRDTSLIEIVVEGEQPAEAAELANVIADVFESERLENKRAQTLRGLKKLREEMDDQYARMKAAQEKVERVRRDLNIFGSVKLNDVTIQQLESQLTAAKVEMVTRKSRLEELKKLSPQQLRNAIATVFSEPTVQALLQNLTESELRLEVLKQDFGPEHPTVRTAIVQRDKLNQQIEARLEGILRGFEIEQKMSEQRLTELQKQLDDLKKSSLDLDSAAFLPYRNALREEESETRVYEALKARIQQTTIEMEVPRSPVELIDKAETPFAPVRPNMMLNLILGGIVGLVLGMGLAFFIEFLDTSVKIMEDVERYLGLPVLGVIPQGTVQLVREGSSSAHLESYRMLRTNIDFSQPGGGHKSLAVLSAGASEGKSFTLVNLAYIYAQQGHRVLVVDSDLRRPTAHKYLDIGREDGLSDYLAGAKTFEEVIHPTKIANVWAIPAGGMRSTKLALPLLTSQRMNQLIREAGERFDVVLYDTPPVLGISDAIIVAREVGNAILVVQHRRFPRAMSLRARKMVEKSGGKLLGVVVNNVHVGHEDTYYYYYHDHYDHYLRGTDVAEAPRRPAMPPAPPPPKKDEIQLDDKY
jgi:capsular exopolysaccharide synthesis family protein